MLVLLCVPIICFIRRSVRTMKAPMTVEGFKFIPALILPASVNIAPFSVMLFVEVY